MNPLPTTLSAATAWRLLVFRYEEERASILEEVTDPLKQNLDQEKKTLRKLEGLAGESKPESLWKKIIDS